MTQLPWTGSPFAGYPASSSAVRIRPASLAQRAAMFSVGAALPLVSFSRSRSFTSDVGGRVLVVDGICIVALLLLLGSRKFKIHRSLKAYYAALIVASFLAIAQGAGVDAVVSLAALVMATFFCILGHSAGQHPALTKALLLGIAIGTLGEAVVVVHDFCLSPWFPDAHPQRVRGTFRTSGQLGVYGFGVAGLLLTVGWPHFEKASSRAIVLTAGFLALFFVFAASRRSGMFALLGWVAVYLILGLRQASRRVYYAMLVLILLACGWLLANAHKASNSFAAQRFVSAASHLADGNSFTHLQLARAVGRIHLWFPFGAGLSRGYIVAADEVGPRHEIHNSHLAVMVEVGLFGLTAFYLMWLRCIRRPWDTHFGRFAHSVRPALIGFIVAAMVFMLHNRLHRDRVAMLLLGLAPASAMAAAGTGSSRYGVQLVRVVRRPVQAAVPTPRNASGS